jgi:hypothetical protein
MNKQIEDKERKLRSQIFKRQRKIIETRRKLELELDELVKLGIDITEACYYVSLEDSIHAINYLVNQIEQKDYQIAQVHLEIYEKWSTIVRGNLIYLVDKDKKEEVENNFISSFDRRFKSSKEYLDLLEVPSDDYVILTFNNENELLDRKINYQREFDARDCLVTSCFKIQSMIFDGRYSYIYDYIDKVISYRLDKQSDILSTKTIPDVTFEEMKMIADDFVKNYQSHKTRTRKLEKNNI